MRPTTFNPTIPRALTRGQLGHPGGWLPVGQPASGAGGHLRKRRITCHQQGHRQRRRWRHRRSELLSTAGHPSYRTAHRRRGCSRAERMLCTGRHAVTPESALDNESCDGGSLEQRTAAAVARPLGQPPFTSHHGQVVRASCEHAAELYWMACAAAPRMPMSSVLHCPTHVHVHARARVQQRVSCCCKRECMGHRARAPPTPAARSAAQEEAWAAQDACMLSGAAHLQRGPSTAPSPQVGCSRLSGSS